MWGQTLQLSLKETYGGKYLVTNVKGGKKIFVCVYFIGLLLLLSLIVVFIFLFFSQF